MVDRMINEKEDFTLKLINRAPKFILQLNEALEIDFSNELSKIRKLTNYMFEKTLSTNVSINGIIICIHNYIQKNIEATKSFFLLTKKGFLSSAFSMNRMIFELWAAAYFIEKNIEDYIEFRDEERFKKLANRLFSGSKYPTTLPWGENSIEKPIHINDMLRKLEEIYPNTMNNYDFLCEYTHPNFLMNYYAFLASKVDDLWNNPKFEKIIIDTLEKQGDSLLKSLKGIKVSVSKIIEICLREYQI